MPIFTSTCDAAAWHLFRTVSLFRSVVRWFIRPRCAAAECASKSNVRGFDEEVELYLYSDEEKCALVVPLLVLLFVVVVAAAAFFVCVLFFFLFYSEYHHVVTIVNTGVSKPSSRGIYCDRVICMYSIYIHLVTRLQCFGVARRRIQSTNKYECVNERERERETKPTSNERMCGWISSEFVFLYTFHRLITSKNGFICEWFVCDMAYRHHIYSIHTILLPLPLPIYTNT